MIPYGGFEIHVELTSSAEDLYEVTVQIKGTQNVTLVGERGIRIPLRNGPFTRRWAYFIAEVAGQAAIDALLSTAAGKDSPA